MTTKKIQFKKNMLFLTLDGFSNTGGIQSVCKSMSYTLNSIAATSDDIGFFSLSLYDHVVNEDYINPKNFKGYKGNRLSFLYNSLKKGVSANVILISHINLLLIACLIKLVNRKAKVVMLAHGIEIWRKIPIWKTLFVNHFVSIWAVSKFTRNVLVRQHNFVPSKIMILNNCLDPFHEAAENQDKPKDLLLRHSLKASQPILLSVCRISENDHEKGYDFTINAIPELLKEFPDIHYFMIGSIDDPELRRINNLIDQLGIKRYVSILGKVSDLELRRYYLLADVFVLPSRKEGFGLVFIEAASFGCTVISGNQDGSREALLDGSLGIPIEISLANLSVEIAKSLRIERNQDARRLIAKRCIEYFGHEQYGLRVIELLQ